MYLRRLYSSVPCKSTNVFYKLTNASEEFTFKYKTGLNIYSDLYDNYQFSDTERVFYYAPRNKINVRTVTIPVNDSLIKLGVGKWQAKRVLLSQPYPLWCLSTISHLVENGAIIHYNEDLLFRLAVHKNHMDIAQYLLLKGANINSFDSDALCSTFENNNIEMAKFLLNNGASLNVKQNLLVHAIKHIKNNDSQIVQLLLKHGILDVVHSNANAITDTLIASFVSHNAHIIKLLYNEGMNIKSESNLIFEYASEYGYLDIIEFLIVRGVEINQHMLNKYLITAITHAHENIVFYLLKLGANINHQNGLPLNTALRYGDREMIQLILDHDVDLSKLKDDNYEQILYENPNWKSTIGMGLLSDFNVLIDKFKSNTNICIKNVILKIIKSDIQKLMESSKSKIK